MNNKIRVAIQSAGIFGTPMYFFSDKNGVAACVVNQLGEDWDTKVIPNLTEEDLKEDGYTQVRRYDWRTDRWYSGYWRKKNV